LIQGRRFEKAAEYFKLAAEKEPTDPRHPLALGCAYASRIASLFHALQFREMLLGAQADYQNSLKAWETNRDEMRANDPEGIDEANEEKNKPIPPPQREFLIKDSSQPLRLTETQLEAHTVELSAKALMAWESGISLAKTPEEKANAYYIQGWGIRVLRQYMEAYASDRLKSRLTVAGYPIKEMPTHETMYAAFDKATIAAPDNPLYWQAKGDALGASTAPGFDSYWQAKAATVGEGDAAIAAYLKALDLKPRNATSLWYLLYQRAAPTEYEKPENEKWALAEEYLRRASARDKSNAWPLYEEAVLKFCRAPYIMTGHDRNRSTTTAEQEIRRAAVRNADARRDGRQAIDLIMRGNSAPRYEPPRYVDSVPNLLAVAWEWRHFGHEQGDSAGYSRARELARSAGTYAEFMASDENDRGEAVRAGWAAVGMGRRLMGDWPTEVDPGSGRTLMEPLVGWAVVTISYKFLLRVYEILGDQNSCEAVAAESAAFKIRSDPYRAIINSHLSRSWIEAY
jgi:hypothetical protein